MKSTTEYDLFGPWIDEVTNTEEVPRLYRAHAIDFSKTDLVLKVPRDIARRDANPDMDLYDALLILEPDALTVLTRLEGGYEKRTVGIDAIVALHDSVLHLDGRLQIHLGAAEPLEISYNGSARSSIDRLVAEVRRLVRARATNSEAPSPTAVPGIADERAALEAVLDPERDYALVGDYVKARRREPNLEFIAAHPTQPAQLRQEASGWQRILHRVRPTFLQGAVYGRTTDELHVLHRRDWVVRGDRDNLSIARLVVFLRAITGVAVSVHPRFQLDVLTLTSGDDNIPLLLPPDFPALEAIRQSA